MTKTAKRLTAAFLVLALLITAIPLMSSMQTVQAAEPSGTMKNVKISGGKLTWSKFSGAHHYLIIVGGEAFDVVDKDTTSYNVEDLAAKEGFSSGKLSVGIVAKDSRDMDLSEPWIGSFQYTSKGQVAKPSNPRWNYGYAQWDAVKNADSYRVIVYEDGEFFSIYDATEPKIYLAKYFSAGKKYAFEVSAMRYHYTASPSVRSGSEIVIPKTPSVVNAAKGFKITWTKVPGAAGYEVWRSADNGKTYIKANTIKSGSTTTYTNSADAANKNGVKYKYKFRAYKTVYGKTCYSNFSPMKACYKVTTPAAPSVSNSGAGRLTVKWKKNSQASGYKILYKTGTTSKTVVVKGTSTLSKTLTGLKKGASYKVYVKAYKTVSGINYNSAWSAAKTVTTTKYSTYKTTDELNYRTAPSMTATKKGTLPKGTTVQVVSSYCKKADDHTWYKINIGSGFYYVAKDYLKKVS